MTAAASPPGAARIAVRTRPLLDVFDLAVRFVAVHAWAYAKIAVFVLPPCAVATWMAGTWGNWWIGWTVAAFLATLAYTPFTLYASRVVFEEGVTVKSVLGQSAAALPKLVGARLLQFLCLGAGLAFFLVPVAWVGATLLYLGEALVLERAKIGQAMSRTQRLSSAAFGDAVLGLGLLFALFAIAALLGDVGGRAIIGELVQATAPEPMWKEGGSLLSVLGFWLFVPFAATVKFLLYLNVRTRSEGWDVQTRFAAIARRSEEAEE
jgi:hypothetical protein